MILKKGNKKEEKWKKRGLCNLAGYVDFIRSI
jgi:hypothetical protein